jgi:subtilisin family serine protease
MVRTTRAARARALVLSLLVGSAVVTSATVAGASDTRAKSGRYIVVFKNTVRHPAAAANAQATRSGAKVSFVYRSALKGYSARIAADRVASLRNNPNVAYVVRDTRMSIDTTQTGATWGLDRIDQANRPLSGTYTYTNTGAGVKAYIIDTGIRYSHQDFGGRATPGFDAIVPGGPANDCNGHGTHVSGTVGGSSYGVAKGVSLIGVRVLSCAGTGLTSWVIAGVDWVTQNHQAGQPAVANMSLGGGVNAALDQAVRNSIADGVAYGVAAGNDSADACTSSPADVSQAMTVGATSQANDSRASFSNFGSCVDWFAPGENITSDWFLTDTSTNTISGTSMATPHTVGVAAQYLQGNPGATPAQVASAIAALATKGIVTNAQSANNNLLFTNL